MSVKDNASPAVQLSEQHPREQGLKLANPTLFGTVKPAFRATSKRTRIETGFRTQFLSLKRYRFQSNIQENKDWNRERLRRRRRGRAFQSNIQENKDWNEED